MSVELVGDIPTLIAYRDGTSAWKTPEPSMGGTYAAHHFELDVSGDYELVAVTVDDGAGVALSTELRATAGDATHWYLDGSGAYDIDEVGIEPGSPDDCSPPDTPFNIDDNVIATGSMVQPGQISIGDSCTSSTKPTWSYQLSVAPGIHDVIATDPMGTTSPRIAIKRAVSIDSGTTVPAIDLAGDGQPLDTTNITVVNTNTYPDDAGAISSTLVLHTANTSAQISSMTDQVVSRSHAVPVVPSSLLDTADSQVLTVSVTDNSNARHVASTRHPTETWVLELLSAPTTSYTTDAGIETATWNQPLESRVEAVDLEIDQVSLTSGATSQAITATTRWLDAHHAMSLAFASDVPGYDPSWMVDLTQMHTAQLKVRGVEGHVSYATTQFQDN